MAKSAGLQQWRRELLSSLQGRVLEIGAGAGSDRPLFPDSISMLDVLESDPDMRRRLARRRRACRTPIAVNASETEALRYRATTFDPVVVTLVLCTVREPNQCSDRPGGRCGPTGSSW